MSASNPGLFFQCHAIIRLMARVKLQRVHNKTFSSVYELRSSFQSSGKADIFEEGRIF